MLSKDSSLTSILNGLSQLKHLFFCQNPKPEQFECWLFFSPPPLLHQGACFTTKSPIVYKPTTSPIVYKPTKISTCL